MQFPESWLRQYCNPDLSSAELADLLTMSGMEVEERRSLAPAFSGVVVGQVLSTERHPNADRLSVCQVDVAQAEPLTIVCGAPNVLAGIRVPVALVGAELPAQADGSVFRISRGKLRGVESHGMLCSAKELGISEANDGLHILPADAPVGANIREFLRLDEQIFTLKLTPNLGHCLSVYGVAREVAALTGTPLQAPKASPVAVSHSAVLPVRVDDQRLCGRFAGRVIRGIRAQARTPDWMVQRLEQCGQRSINPLVDISNYVMFELGRPSHIFDLGKVHGGLQVRMAQAGEKIELLNGQTIELSADMGIIADDHGPESLAGIMGGQATAVSDETQDVYLEAAFWWPEAIAGRARRLGFSTDASHRFERGVDPESLLEHVEYITALVLDICGGQAGPVDDQVLALPVRPAVSLRCARAAKVIGMPVTLEQITQVMHRLGLPHQVSGDVVTVQPPAWRFDLQIEEDLIEEVIRVLGYTSLPNRAPMAALTPLVKSESSKGPHALRHALADRGYFETINFSFVEAAWERDLSTVQTPIQVLNPIASPLSVMRTTLIGSLLQVLRHNLSRKASRVRVFEIGRVFLPDEQAVDGPTQVRGITQPQRLSGLAYGPVSAAQWGQTERAVDFFDVKGDLEAVLEPGLDWTWEAAEHPAMHPGRCARLLKDGQAVGFVGELHPRWRQQWDLPQAPIVFELDLAAVSHRAMPRFAAVPKQQSVWRDLALVAPDSLTHQALQAAIGRCGEGLIRQCTLFDVFKPKAGTSSDLQAGERSLAVRLELLDPVQALTEERIDAVIRQVLQTLQSELGLRLRG